MSDKKDAVNIGITLSTQIIAASLTMIAVIGAFAAFVIDKREVGFSYYIITGLSFLLFVTSIYLGGKGVDRARKSGYEGKWSISNTKSFFNYQAITALSGVILFSISVFMGQEKSENIKAQLKVQEKQMKEMNTVIIEKMAMDSLLMIDMQGLKDSLANIKREVLDLRSSKLNKLKDLTTGK